MTKAIRNGLIDGLSNALLLFLCSELFDSVFLNSSINACIVASAVCAAISIAVFYILLRKLDNWISIYFASGILFFVLVNFLLFIAKVELHIFLFPKQTLGYADGLVILFCYLFYLLIAEIGRIIGCFSRAFNNTVSKKTI